MKTAIQYIFIVFVPVCLMIGCKKDGPCGSKTLYEITEDSALLRAPDSMWIEISNTSGKVQGTYLFQKQPGKKYTTHLLREDGIECARRYSGKGFFITYKSFELNDSFKLGYIQDMSSSIISFLYNDFYYKGSIDPDYPEYYRYFGLIIKDSLYHYYDRFCIENYYTNYNCVDYPLYHDRKKGVLQVIMPQSNTVFTRIFK